MSERINIDVDTSQMHKKLNEVDRKVDEVEAKANKTIQTIEKSTNQSYRRVLSMARSAYLAGAAMIRASGVSVSYFMTSLISASVSAIAILQPLFVAKAAAGDYVSAYIGMMNLEIAIAAMIEAQMGQSKLAQQLASANEGLHNIQTFLTYIPSLW